ncbi:MAG: hypothetical protein ACJATP_003019 [Candidatus Azotimanducaceae bacterium]|jgi:hypothetical protein
MIMLSAGYSSRKSSISAFWTLFGDALPFSPAWAMAKA